METRVSNKEGNNLDSYLASIIGELDYAFEKFQAIETSNDDKSLDLTRANENQVSFMELTADQLAQKYADPGLYLFVSTEQSKANKAIAVNLVIKKLLSDVGVTGYLCKSGHAKHMVKTMLLNLTQIDAERFEIAEFRTQDWGAFNKGITFLSKTKLIMKEFSTVDAKQLERLFNEMAERTDQTTASSVGNNLVVIDGLANLLKEPKSLSATLIMLKAMAKKFKIAIILTEALSEPYFETYPNVRKLKQWPEFKEHVDLVTLIDGGNLCQPNFSGKDVRLFVNHPSEIEEKAIFPFLDTQLYSISYAELNRQVINHAI